MIALLPAPAPPSPPPADGDEVFPFAGTPIPIQEPRWWAIHTRPRCEKRMADWLRLERHDQYLPLRRSVRFYPGKRVEFFKPLFPGYTFGCFSLLARQAVFHSDFAANILHVADQTHFLTQIEPIKQALALDAPLELCPYLESGARVRITAGRFRGLEGIVQRKAGKTRIVLSVDILQRSVSMEIDTSMVMVVG